jgi:hypothetical protein
MSVWLHPLGDQLEEGEATIDQWLKNTFIGMLFITDMQINNNRPTHSER